AFGISGDRIEHLLWRIIEGKELAGAKPTMVVILIGTNNLGADRHGHLTAPGDSAEVIAAGVEAVVAEVRQQLPDAQVLLLGILPRGESATASVRSKIKEVNQRLTLLAKDEQFLFADLGEHFLETDGRIREDLMPDALHLSAKGYMVLAD